MPSYGFGPRLGQEWVSDYGPPDQASVVTLIVRPSPDLRRAPSHQRSYARAHNLNYHNLDYH